MEYSCLVCGACADGLLRLLVQRSSADESPAPNSALLEMPHPTWSQVKIRIIIHTAAAPLDELQAPHAMLFGFTPVMASNAHVEWAAWVAQCKSPPCVVLAGPNDPSFTFPAAAAQALQAKAYCAVPLDSASPDTDPLAAALRVAVARACIGELLDSPCVANALESKSSVAPVAKWTWRRHSQTGRVYYMDRHTRRAQYRRPEDYDGEEPQANALDNPRDTEMRRATAERLEAKVALLRERHAGMVAQREHGATGLERIRAQCEEYVAQEKSTLRESAEAHAALEEQILNARRELEALRAADDDDEENRVECVSREEREMREAVADTRAAVARWRGAVERNALLRTALSRTLTLRATQQRRVEAALAQSAALDTESTALETQIKKERQLCAATVTDMAPMAKRIAARHQRLSKRRACIASLQWREAFLAAEVRAHISHRHGAPLHTAAAAEATHLCRAEALHAYGTVCAGFTAVWRDCSKAREELRSVIAQFMALREECAAFVVARRAELMEQRIACMRAWYNGTPRTAEVEAKKMAHIDTMLECLGKQGVPATIPKTVTAANKMVCARLDERNGNGNANEGPREPLEDCWAWLVRRIADTHTQYESWSKEREVALRHEMLQCAASALLQHFSTTEMQCVAQRLAEDRTMTEEGKVLSAALMSEENNRCRPLDMSEKYVAAQERGVEERKRTNGKLREKMMKAYA